MTDADLAARLVREAGTLAHRMRGDGIAADTKTSVSDVVTAADHAAERQVVDTLAVERPDDGVLGEEGASRAGTSGRTWVIDPVDGTYNFVAGLDWWCSALALIDGDDLLVGAVHHPATGRTFVGGPDLPPHVDGVPLAPLVDRPLAESCLTTYLHPPFYGDEVGAAFGRMANGAATVRMLGSGTMDAMAVAEGRLHVLCQHSVPPWDELPGAAIIRGVGGHVAKVRAAGRDWHVAGAPTAVAEVVALLSAGAPPAP
ncbi:fructose 1,6-bisphosphatase [Nocardioides sp. Root1257]|uniref:inositol monophosphatase family protein n=1 Tax=unclassified Nocardioides TaxID=2615069 RepID=UPI0006FE6C3D|nr:MULTISPECIES: inositol monophosphatase family protein [unclassified Nocardioides]KQW43143.1 fructose 1,6-bisphosphatase [Nocardioides sp. Root1257]KRC42012.1 fructose 1,6-bisphosphatase [Nocardioides sp. Root224]